MTIYLAVHHRTHTPHGFAINRASITALGGPGIHGPDRHGTHAYVVARVGGYLLRLDGDVPRATFMPWGASYGVPQTGHGAPLLWRCHVGQAGMDRFMRLAYERPPYDPAEIGQATLTALVAFLDNLPMPFRGSVGVASGIKNRAQVHDAVRGAMICTRLASRVLDVEPPDLYPESLARMARALGWSGPHLPSAIEEGRA